MDTNTPLHLDQEVCRQARLARDPRFDGLFFVGVHSTGIFCRPICPAPSPREENVHYYGTALSALQADLRPCLRCRPESAPGSPAWRGSETTFIRAIKLIDDGQWRAGSLVDFATRLGVTDRYLRKLFQQHLGISPLKYAHFRRTLFAKQLLQQTSLSIATIAEMVGFNSTRSFNRVFMHWLGINAKTIRRTAEKPKDDSRILRLFLSYRPPYDWPTLRDFYLERQIDGIEIIDHQSYGRSFTLPGCEGIFRAMHIPEQHGFRIALVLTDYAQTIAAVRRIRQLLDLDADPHVIHQHLSRHLPITELPSTGVRIPGIWSPFEAGVRAIIGQQISVKAAGKQVNRLVAKLGRPVSPSLMTSELAAIDRHFPDPKTMINADLSFLSITNKRRRSLQLLAAHYLSHNPSPSDDIDEFSTALQDWLSIPGIGPWTVAYAAMRSGHPNIFLDGDLGVRHALQRLSTASNLNLQQYKTNLSPWGSYATISLWQQLSQAQSEIAQ